MQTAPLMTGTELIANLAFHHSHLDLQTQRVNIVGLSIRSIQSNPVFVHIIMFILNVLFFFFIYIVHVNDLQQTNK